MSILNQSSIGKGGGGANITRIECEGKGDPILKTVTGVQGTLHDISIPALNDAAQKFEEMSRHFEDIMKLIDQKAVHNIPDQLGMAGNKLNMALVFLNKVLGKDIAGLNEVRIYHNGKMFYTHGPKLAQQRIKQHGKENLFYFEATSLVKELQQVLDDLNTAVKKVDIDNDTKEKVERAENVAFLLYAALISMDTIAIP